MLIEIKAEMLRNCPYGFEFIDLNNPNEYRYMLTYEGEDIQYKTYSNRRWMGTDTIVQVDADAYRDACIERIKSVLKDVMSVEKYKHGHVMVHLNNDSYSVPVETDPWPHLETAEWEV